MFKYNPSQGPRNYIITLVNYTNGDIDVTDYCAQADRDTMRIHFGDGDSIMLLRSNGNVTDQYGFPTGDSICSCRKVNIYTTGPAGYNFPGASATYHIWIDDADRMANINNIATGGTNSSTVDFYIFTALNIDPFVGADVSSPVITNPLACEYACTGQCYYYNLGAYSPTGDSISYSLGNCLVLGGLEAPQYYIPAGAAIDPVTGTLSWCNPTTDGIYNFSILLTSYKHVTWNGTTFARCVDTMEVELSVVVNSNCTTHDPKITGVNDTCVVAGDLLKLYYTATDTDNYVLTMTAEGEPDSLSPPATFVSTPAEHTVKGTYSWQTNCSDVRSAPYYVTVKVYDPGDCPSCLIVPPNNYSNYPPLSSYTTTTIHVIAPAPTNLKANVLGSTVQLTWDPSICPLDNIYYIYRATGCVKFVPGPCETGVPASSGYVKIGTNIGLNNTSFGDNTVVPGVSYSYLVVAASSVSGNTAYSIASNDTCVLAKRNVPLITNVSVDNTDASNGKIFVRWMKPNANSGYLDTNAYPGPYTYTLWRDTGINNTNFSTQVFSITTPYFKPAIDTTIMDAGLNTQSDIYKYRLNFFCDTVSFGAAPPSSSIFLSAKPGDQVIKLSWVYNVPWADSAFMIYRRGPHAPAFSYLATVPGSIQNYTDSNLTNDTTICYYVKSVSHYADTTVLRPLYDSSEIICMAPKDTVPPCPPHLAVSPKCNTFEDSLVWNNPDHFCNGIYNDILQYNIYYSPTQGGDMQLIKTIYNVNDTIFVNDSLTSIAGCYAVTAVDSFGNQSAIVPVCVDNCPQYQLPNVFTPIGGNGVNNIFTPILPYRYIQSIDINIFNRWGQLMFHTNNPMINWDGTDQTTHGQCPDGVYYYVCVVNEIHVDGIKPVVLKGFVQILR